jgi:hypothetical protein
MLLSTLPNLIPSPHQYHTTAARNHPWRARRHDATGVDACHGGQNVVVVFPFFQRNGCVEPVDTMPSLFRILLVLCMLAGAAYGAMYALANLYNPKPREITVSVPPDKFSKQH